MLYYMHKFRYPCIRSKDENNFFPRRLSISSSMFGMALASFLVIKFNLRKSKHTRELPSFFTAIDIGDA